MTEDVERRLIAAAADDVRRELGDSAAPEVVDAAFAVARASYRDAKVRTYVPVLVARKARELLARSRGGSLTAS